MEQILKITEEFANIEIFEHTTLSFNLILNKIVNKFKILLRSG